MPVDQSCCLQLEQPTAFFIAAFFIAALFISAEHARNAKQFAVNAEPAEQFTIHARLAGYAQSTQLAIIAGFAKPARLTGLSQQFASAARRAVGQRASVKL